jgi:hypothetical protein
VARVADEAAGFGWFWLFWLWPGGGDALLV